MRRKTLSPNHARTAECFLDNTAKFSLKYLNVSFLKKYLNVQTFKFKFKFKYSSQLHGSKFGGRVMHTN